VPYAEKDVSRDQRAAQEMVQRSGQMGVPVITVDENVIVGFDQPRLEKLLGSSGASPRFGAAVAARPGGLLVGNVHPGTPAARAGVRAGDLIVSVNATPVHSTDDLPRRLAEAARLSPRVPLRVLRDGKEVDLLAEPPAPQSRAG
jgi:S1-C subfamily serine protease